MLLSSAHERNLLLYIIRAIALSGAYTLLTDEYRRGMTAIFRVDEIKRVRIFLRVLRLKQAFSII
jgi:hypothetical protein